MGIDILFPIVGAPSPFLSLHSARRPPLPIQPLFLRPIHPPSRFASLSLFLPLSLFFGQHSAFFSIIILFRIQSIISISIVLRYFHLASRFERDGTRAMAREMNEEGDTRWTEGGGSKFRRRGKGGFGRLVVSASPFSVAPFSRLAILEPYTYVPGITMASSATIR